MPIELPAALTVDQLMHDDPVTVPPSLPVVEAIRHMDRARIGAVVVVDDGQLVGIFTERDLLRRIANTGCDQLNEPISRFMTTNVSTIAPDATWEEARAQMGRLHVRRLPVVRNGQLVGLVTMRELMARSNDYLNREVAARTHELRRAYEQLRERDQELRLHMTVAGRIQARLMPSPLPRLDEVDFASWYQPLDPLGGDDYEFATPDPRHLGILIADATGHSIPAALVAIMAHAAFATASRRSTRPAEVLADMNRRLHGITGDHFVTAFYGIFDRETRVLTYANAGQPYPLHYSRRTRECTPLALPGLILGVGTDVSYEERRLELESGDRLLFYTDGVIEARNEAAKHFGIDGVTRTLLESAEESATSICQRLADRVTAFRGAEPATDDLTILVAAVR